MFVGGVGVGVGFSDMMESGVGVGFSDMMKSESKIFFRLHNPGSTVSNKLLRSNSFP